MRSRRAETLFAKKADSSSHCGKNRKIKTAYMGHTLSNKGINQIFSGHLYHKHLSFSLFSLLFSGIKYNVMGLSVKEGTPPIDSIL
jgi:hypothetical protein